MTPLTDLNELQDEVAAIQARRIVSEQAFISRIPLLGHLVVWMRSAWNWMSTKWYVIPLVQQQNAFNASVAQAWSELVLYLKSVIRFAAHMYARLDDLEKRLDQVEQAQTAASVPGPVPPFSPGEIARLVQAMAPSWCALISTGPVLVLSCEQEVLRGLAGYPLQAYGVTSDPASVQQYTESGLDVQHASDSEHLAELPDESLGGVVAAWDGPLSIQTAVHLLDQCQRVLRVGGWAIWMWPGPSASQESEAQTARSIALGMGFQHVRLEAHQRAGSTSQTLLIQK